MRAFRLMIRKCQCEQQLHVKHLHPIMTCGRIVLDHYAFVFLQVPTKCCCLRLGKQTRRWAAEPMAHDPNLAATGAVPKALGRPELRHAIGMHGWLKAQADKIDDAKARIIAEQMEAGPQVHPVDARGHPAVFSRIGHYTLAPGFNPGRWTTYVAGRPTVVQTQIPKQQGGVQSRSCCALTRVTVRAFRLMP